MEEPEQQRRRTVFLDRSHLRLALRLFDLHVPDVPHLAAGFSRYFSRLVGQHQQSAHDERDLQSWSTPRTSKAVRQRNAWTRQQRQQTTERLRPRRQSARAVLCAAEHEFLAARAERRL